MLSDLTALGALFDLHLKSHTNCWWWCKFCCTFLLRFTDRRARRTLEELKAEAEKLEQMVSGVRKQLQLSGLCEYVDVRARDHVNMKYVSLCHKSAYPLE